MTKEEIKVEANNLFASTNHQVLFANPRGEFFTTENIGELSLKPKEVLMKLERPEETTEAKKEKTLNQGETIAAILKVETIEGLALYEADERKGVKAAYEDKYAKLVANIKVNLDTTDKGTGDGNADTDTKK
jgi:hypothetical protein